VVVAPYARATAPAVGFDDKRVVTVPRTPEFYAVRGDEFSAGIRLA
jgi:hypothetical protein